MRWFFLLLIVVNIVAVSLVFNANLNEPSPNAVAIQESLAFPTSLVMMNELETLPTEVAQTPLTNRQSIRPATSFDEIIAFGELEVLNKSPLDRGSADQTDDYEASGLTRVCISLTNLEKDEDMASITQLLSSSKIYPEIYTDSSPYYWVFIPSAAVVGSVRDTIVAIRDLKLDAHLLKDGVHRGGISTGVFINENNAKRYAVRLRELGFNASIERRDQKKYRIVIEQKFVRIFNNEVFADLRRQFNFVKIDENPC